MERLFVHCFQIELQFRSVVEGGKPEILDKNT